MYSKVCLLTIVLLNLHQSSAIVDNRDTLHVLIALPLTNGSIRLAESNKIGAWLAKERIEKEQLIDTSLYKIKFEFIDDCCDGTSALQGAWAKYLRKYDLFMEDGPQYLTSVIGMTCNQVCRPVGAFYDALNIPVVSIGCTADVLSRDEDDESYNLFARVVTSWTVLVKITVLLLQEYEWDRVAVITASDFDWLAFSTELKNALDAIRVTADLNYTVTNDPVKGFITPKMEVYRDCNTALKTLGSPSETTINIYIFLLQDAQVLTCLLTAKTLNLIKGKAFLAYGYSIDGDGSKNFLKDVGELTETQQGLLSINVKHSDDSWKEFVSLFEEYYKNFSDFYLDKPEKEVNLYAGLLYDAVLLWGYAVNKTLAAFEDTGLVKEEVAGFYELVEFEGATGRMRMEKNGDRKCDYVIEVVNKELTYEPVFEYAYDTKSLKRLKMDGSFYWPGMSVEVPSSAATPQEKKGISLVIIIAACVFAAIVLIMVIVALICLRKTRYESAIRAVNAWIIRWEDIITDAPEKEHMYTAAIRRSVVHEVTRVTFGVADQKQQQFSDFGYYKGIVVSIKPVDRKYSDQQDPILLNELRSMINIKHENLNVFVGVCLDEPNVCMLTLYAKHGSLHNVLMDDDMELPLEFKLSFALDISKGMEYLHASPLVSHGHLSSTNCVVDKKWTCKVTDYGMGEFQKTKKPREGEQTSNQLWTAPELLRLAVEERPLAGTQPGDVYSYGIILQELALRDVPYAIERKQHKIVDILAKVAVSLTPPFRPSVTENSCPEAWQNLMVNCWDEQPELRPTFKKVTIAVRKMSAGKTINIIDNMLEKLEKHTQHLEFLVAERTNDLNAEKKKVEALLYNILPKTVAESLLKRGYVEPETFESVTIYFSDIVGFIRIGQNSTAYEVVNLLNDLYSTFDGITDKYDVYKCETIGDVYMVASGLPERNGDRHAPEIATMALHLLSAISSFTIRHMRRTMLQLRIGLHTGSVVAGVVGLKMPHYCLFGDTVNTASRMQSGGLALRIHISSVTADILSATGVFFLELRGEREVKGKGIMTTYWVLGKKGFDMPMPDLSRAAKPEEHDFK